jgi:hypothetical protein
LACARTAPPRWPSSFECGSRGDTAQAFRVEPKSGELLIRRWHGEASKNVRKIEYWILVSFDQIVVGVDQKDSSTKAEKQKTSAESIDFSPSILSSAASTLGYHTQKQRLGLILLSFNSRDTHEQ